MKTKTYGTVTMIEGPDGGQILPLPRALIRDFRLLPGDTVTIVSRRDGLVLRCYRRSREGWLQLFSGGESRAVVTPHDTGRKSSRSAKAPDVSSRKVQIKLTRSIAKMAPKQAAAHAPASLTGEQKWNLIRLRSAGVEETLLQEEGGLISGDAFVKNLKITHRTLRSYVNVGEIFTVPRGARKRVYPAWQIHDHRLLAGLSSVLALLSAQGVNPLGIVHFFLTPASALGDKSPLDLLRTGEVALVKKHVERLGLHGA